MKNLYLCLILITFLISPGYSGIKIDSYFGQELKTYYNSQPISYVSFQIEPYKNYKEAYFSFYLKYENYFSLYGLQNKPFQDVYHAGINFKYDIFYFNFNHYCVHLVDQSLEQDYYTYNYKSMNSNSYKIGITLDFN